MTRPMTIPPRAVPDLTRRIFPVVAVVTTEGFRRLTEDETAGYAQAVIEERMREPGGPIAPLHSDRELSG